MRELSAKQENTQPVPLHPWEFPAQAWSRLHVDFAGLFRGKLFIVLVDAHSKWLEVAVVSSCSSLCAIKFLRNVFATHGIPDQLVSDNGSAFTSSEFKEFVNRNGIRHTTSAPYHPASNSLAERAVQTFKSALIKSGGDVETSLACFLFTYRLTPHTTTGLTPAEMLLGSKPRSQLDSIRPRSGTAIADKVKTSQARQKANHDARAKDRSFGLNDPVYSKDVGGKQEWIPGVIRKFTGPVSAIVELEDGRMCRRHFNHLRVRHDARPERVQVNERNTLPADRAQATRERKAVVTGANGGPTVTPSGGSGSAATTPSQSEEATPSTGESEKRDENMPETAGSNEEDHAEQGGTEEATRTEKPGTPPEPTPIRRSNRTRVPPERYGFKKGGM